MDYVKVILSGLAAIFLACVVVFWPVVKHVSRQTAIGLDVFVAGIHSPILWILAILFFAIFLAASRIGNQLLKILVFWIPTLLFSTLGIVTWALFTYVFILLKHRSNP